MPKNKKTYDIFLSYSHDMIDQAERAIDKFSEAGLSVFGISKSKPGKDMVDEAWQALAVSWAVVALIKPGTMPSSVAVEIGAASAWQKSIFILIEGQGTCDVPVYLSICHVFHISDIDNVIKQIRKILNPLNDDERNALIKAYSEFGLPTDKLLMQPAYIEKLNKLLFQKFNLQLSGERIMQELLRLRKQGKLTRIHKKTLVK